MKNKPITTIDKLRAIPWVYGFSAGNMVFCLLTVFGPIFPLYLTGLGMPYTKIGFIVSLIPFCGLVSLVLSRWVTRVGPKRIFITFYSVRKLVVGLLLISPWIMARFGSTAVFYWVAGIIVLFALCRGIAEIGYLPWAQEFVPNRIRGKVDAINSLISGVVALLVALGASWIVKQVTGLTGYSLLIGVGVLVGLISVVLMGFVPGGRPMPVEQKETPFWEEMLGPIRDRNFQYYLGGVALFSLGIGFFSFLPIFLKNQIGLGSDKILLLDAVMRIGILSSSFLWGWSVDRFGGKPVQISGLIIMLLFPLILIFMPREQGGVLAWVMTAYVILGVGLQGYMAGANRYFFIRAVPPGNRNQSYYSLNYACLSLFSALGPLGAGCLLDMGRFLQIHHWGIVVDAFMILFASSTAVLIASAWMFHRMGNDGVVRTGEFLSMFIQGNPLLAFESMVRYRLARDEGHRISVTEQMGQTKNALSADDLLEALSDPSFNVRYEAIVSAAHMPPHSKLTEALIHILRRKEPDLSVVAGWALGRIGDRRAVPALREMLVSEYALLRSRSARSLANLGDTESVPLLLKAFKNELHDGIRVAYASALGVFKAEAALDDLIGLLHRLTEEPLRNEVALALARIIGGEHHYIRLWRATRSDFGTAGAQTIMDLKEKMFKQDFATSPVMALMDDCAQHLGGQDLDLAALAMCRLLDDLAPEPWGMTIHKLLRECARYLLEFKGERAEYMLLAFTALEAGIVAIRRRKSIRVEPR